MSEQRIITYAPEIRFADIDSMGHVNNAVYLTYFEQARMNYFRELMADKWDWKGEGVMLGRNEVDYLKPIFLHDDINIEVWCDGVGNKSFVMNYRFVNAQSGEITTQGKSILVCFDHNQNSSIPVPEKWRSFFSVTL